MQKLIAAALFVIAAPMLMPSQAQADDYDDLDAPDKKKASSSKKAKKASSEAAKEELVREVERGLYAKATVGSATPILTYGVAAPGGGTLRSGTVVGLSIGQDFLDQERKSMAWEVSFSQGVHNGVHYEEQAYLQLPPSTFIQGDTRTYNIGVTYEYSGYLGRRFGLGFRVGGGLTMTPWLIYSARREEVLSELGVAQLPVHDQPFHPYGMGGPTIEYYTKLSHFSIGADVDAAYAIGFDLMVTGTGYLKYTF